MRVTWSSPTAKTSCRAGVEWSRTRAAPQVRANRDRWQELLGNESVSSIYSSAGRYDLVDGRIAAGRAGRVSTVARLRTPRSGLPHHPGGHVLSRRRFRSDGLLRHRAARKAIRSGPGPEPDDVNEFFWKLA